MRARLSVSSAVSFLLAGGIGSFVYVGAAVADDDFTSQ